jgi:hypothetical protein
MSTVRWRLINLFDAINTYGYITKSARIDLGIEKSHHNDAFVIACGTDQKRAETMIIEQLRRNNRSLETFKDAKYIDLRNGEIRTGCELFSGRRKRNKNKSGENLRVYRAQKVRKGKRSIRWQRYSLRPSDIVLHEGIKRVVKGVHSYGKAIFLWNERGKYSVMIKNIKPLLHRSGLSQLWTNGDKSAKAGEAISVATISQP